MLREGHETCVCQFIASTQVNGGKLRASLRQDIYFEVVNVLATFMRKVDGCDVIVAQVRQEVRVVVAAGAALASHDRPAQFCLLLRRKRHGLTSCIAPASTDAYARTPPEQLDHRPHRPGPPERVVAYVNVVEPPLVRPLARGGECRFHRSQSFRRKVRGEDGGDLVSVEAGQEPGEPRGHRGGRRGVGHSQGRVGGDLVLCVLRGMVLSPERARRSTEVERPK
mmetsp:Transcript_104625/g.301671  ORF Transcript_104625/g.301671 Transcript_104625/m.301671 type:complete len:224 (+) Transcript_104625:1001-1672(+)